MPITIKHTQQAGFSLLELMITMAIVSILAMVAAPSFKSILENNRTLAVTNQLVSSFNFARSKAITKEKINVEIGGVIVRKRIINATVCVRNTAGNGCSTVGNFSDGWLIQANLADGTTAILKDVQMNTPNLTIDSSLKAITYTPIGNSKQSGHFYIKSNGVAKHKILIAMNTGRIRSCRLPEGETECAD